MKEDDIVIFVIGSIIFVAIFISLGAILKEGYYNSFFHDLKSGKETIKLDNKEYKVKFIEIKRKEIIEEVK